MQAEDHAADELQRARREGWYIGIPLYSLQRRTWQLYAFDTTEKPSEGRRMRERIAVGATEEECVRDIRLKADELREHRRELDGKRKLLP